MKTLKPIFSILLSLIQFCAAVSCRAQAVSDVLENDLLENAVRLSPRALEYVPDGFESSVYVWRRMRQGEGCSFSTAILRWPSFMTEISPDR